MTNAIIFGILISIIFYEITDISPGGIIVPALMVLYIDQLDRMVYTIIVAIITYLIVKLMSRYLIIFGKRRFVLLIIISLLVNLILQVLLRSFSIYLLNISVIGYTISGLIANAFYRQGIKRTLPSLIIVLSIIELVLLCINQLGF